MLPSFMAFLPQGRFSRKIPHTTVCAAALFLFASVAAAQQTPVPARITQPIDAANLTVLKGNVHPLARAEFDRGPAPSSLPLNRMLLVLQRSPAQETALESLLDAQQDKSSPNYHQWLTPQQFGQQFGPADADIQTVVSWLQSQGFQVDKIANGRGTIEFSGTAAQLHSAFHTEIDKYAVNGQTYLANSTDPQIPAALAPVVAGVATLHNFLKKPQIKIAEKRIAGVWKPGAHPQVTFQNGSHALAPGDFETIYNLAPVINGTGNGPPAGSGTTITVVGRSNINVEDVTDFRNIFGVAGFTPQVMVEGPDPGDLGGVEEAEAVLDTTWSGALAPGANVRLVVSASTNTTDGVDLSEVYIIDNSVGAIMTESFGTCEAGVTAAEATNISQLAEQAAAEGITYIVSAGDTGSAGCDNLSETQATGPFSVNALASSPFTVAVGGAQFDESGNDAIYWNSSNNQYTLGSARSYIPEDVWNESCTTAECGQNANIASGGGGASVYFTKPAWQSGVTGIPNDGMRDVPDVSLTAAAGHDPYLLCLDGSCQPDAQGNISFAAIGGTSASAPSFAGIIALVNAAVVPLNSHPRLGQINYVLYRLAASENLSSCNGSSTSGLPASNCIFNDVTTGDNAVPGEAGYGTATAEYQSGTGYDLASGLGSMNVANLVSEWTTVSFSPTTTTLSVSPTTFTHGTSVNVSVSVASANGTPTGDVSLFRSGIGGTPSLPVEGNFFTLNTNGSVSMNTNLLPGGYYAIGAHYTGDGAFGASDSNNVALTVSPEPSSTVAKALTLDPNGNFIAFTSLPYGSFVYLRADVAGQSGVAYATGSINFTDGGANIVGDPYVLNAEGYTATPQGLLTLAAGQHSIIANYGGDPDFNPSTSAPVSFAITQASTQTTLQSSGSASQSITLTATVSATSRGNSPTGTVKFFSGQTLIGSAALGQFQNTSGLATATATLSTTQLATGQDSVTAQYVGDTNYQGSTSSPITVTAGPSFVMAANPTAITISSPGQSGSTTLMFTAQDGFTGSANLVPSMCANLPAESTCTFSPSTVTFTSSTTTVPVTLTITTTAPSSLVPLALPFAPVPGLPATIPALVFLAMLACALLLASRRRRAWSAVLALAAFAVMAVAVGCGGGGTGGGGGGGTHGNTNPGTPVGNYAGVTVTVTIGGVTQSINTLSVDVQ